MVPAFSAREQDGFEVTRGFANHEARLGQRNATPRVAIDTFADRCACARATCAAVARLEVNARGQHHDSARGAKIRVDLSSHSSESLRPSRVKGASASFAASLRAKRYN